MKDNGKTILSKVKVLKNLQIYPSTMAHIKKESHMDTESMNGKMVKIMKVNGLME